jgi:alpha-galactosidase
MANLTVKGWNFIEQIGTEILPYNGIEIYSKDKTLNLILSSAVQQKAKNLFVITIGLRAEKLTNSASIKFVWKVPAINLKGTWFTDYTSDRRIFSEFDNERMLISRAAYQAPVVNLFSHDDANIHTFACSDAINTLSLGTGLYEAEGWLQCNVILFTEPVPDFKEYEIKFLLDYREHRYEASLNAVSEWWASMNAYKPMHVPNVARMPMYSTWYSYNQEMTTQSLLEECKAAKKMGYETVIVDDGWQTTNSEGLYARTGDWRPDRFPNMKEFVQNVHDEGLKVMLWYAVPFFGINSDAYKKYEGKFLYISEKYETAIVDPRYPEIRKYLVDLYVEALQEWKLDGFKLDFIDWFIPGEQTELKLGNGRDFTAIGPAVDTLLTEVMQALIAINPEILIEFRQHYIGPVLRKCGNMFRAHDCANDSTTNRRRIIDLRLLTGNTAVHSDMLMWNYEEPTELAALQLVNILFSVPQLSVRLMEVSEAHRKMIEFYTNYWIENRDVLMDGKLMAIGPVENFPIISATTVEKQIISVHTDRVLEISQSKNRFDIVNGKTSNSIFIKPLKDLGDYTIRIVNCLGDIVESESRNLKKGIIEFQVPVSGIISLCKNSN